MAVSFPAVETSGTCRHCGRHVSEAFRRTYGDNENEAHRCPGCDSWVRLQEGSAAGLDAPTPDPQDNQWRAPARWSG